MGGLVAALLLLAAGPAKAKDAALAVHLLDYIAVDYAEAVAEPGKVRNADEYQEMLSFSANVRDLIEGLPAAAGRNSLAAAATTLAERIASRAAPAEVASAAVALRQALVATYAVAIGPKAAPDLARGRQLYARHCAACHGPEGRGDGPAAKGLEPAPSNFHDRERQRHRSAYGLYNTITRGVEGTAMAAFAHLAEADRWALAYVAANYAASESELVRGKTLLNAGASRAGWTTQDAIAGRTPDEVRAQGGDDAVAIQAYLRANPAVLEGGRPAAIAHARAMMARSAELHAAGDREGATRAALSAYLEGFELVEASLGTLDAALVRDVERAMIEYRNRLAQDATEEVRSAAARVDALLERAQTAHQGSLSPSATFFASLVILLREGLEAVLVVSALVALLRRGGQAGALRFVHAGWIVALLLGAATWYAATALISIGGAQREVAEGVIALVASAMLVYVGFWLHQKSNSQAWRDFVTRGAADRSAGWLAVIAFLAVYREVFETVLFYQALWLQAPGQGGAILGGAAVALVALAAVTFAMLRYSIRMPLGLFFGAGGILLAAIAVVMAGNGVAALQEAGWLPISPVDFVTISWLGIHPNLQSLGTQAVLAIIVAALLTRTHHTGTAPAS